MDIDDIEEFDKKFESRVKWLQKNVAPDDIYPFAQQALLAAEYFIYRLSDAVDLGAAMEKDKTVKEWVTNILGIRRAHDIELDFVVNIDWIMPKKL